jgi:hypothetical protein
VTLSRPLTWAPGALNLRIGGPRIGVAVTAVERVDVLEDHVSGAGHLLSDVVGSAILSEVDFGSDEKQKRPAQAHFLNARALGRRLPRTPLEASCGASEA